MLKFIILKIMGKHIPIERGDVTGLNNKHSSQITLSKLKPLSLRLQHHDDPPPSPHVLPRPSGYRDYDVHQSGLHAEDLMQRERA